MTGSRSKSYSVVKSQRADQLQRRREERAAKRAYARERQSAVYLTDDASLASWTVQLNKLGLEIRDIPADGNCLFRALGDQLDGHSNNHLQYRAAVCNYMTEHKDDFAPFIDDGISFAKYMTELRKSGTFAGNDVLVAFTRLYEVKIVIHQLDGAALQINADDNATAARELHLTYHNGEHYSSVRRIGDKSRSPAQLRFKSQGEQNNFDEEKLPQPINDIIAAIMKRTGCDDYCLINQVLEDYDNDVEATVDYIDSVHKANSPDASSESGSQVQLSIMTSDSTGTVDSGVWSDKGSESSVTSKSKDDSSTKKEKKLSKAERKRNKKKRAEERHKLDINKNYKESEDTYEITAQLTMLSV